MVSEYLCNKWKKLTFHFFKKQTNHLPESSAFFYADHSVYNFLIKYNIILLVHNIDGMLAFSPSIPVIV